VRHLEDGFGRRFHYLRLSVTEACNYRCTYCLPNGYRKSAPHDFLSVTEIGRLVRAFQAAGVRKVRLTGGEPSARKDLTEIIAAVSRAGAHKVALTTNGWSLSRRIGEWIDAGLTHLNVSVDSLDAESFVRVTGHDDLAVVLEGVERALASDRISVKLNAVLLRETLDQGFSGFADFVRHRPVSARFIELMRTGDNAEFFSAQHVSGAVLRDWLAAEGWRPIERGTDDGPATEFVHPDYAGRFGLIAPYAPGFCDSCNRLRVTARGRLRLCLFGEGGIDLRDLLQNDADSAELNARIADALSGKSAGHRLRAGVSGDTLNLAQIGG
jgi:cyclic pyranopterin phosphate synthase